MPTGVWSIAEISIGFISSCLPVLPKNFQVIGPKLASNKSNNTPSRSYYKSLDVQKSSASNDIRDPYAQYDSRRDFARGYRELDGLELDSGIGNRKIDADPEGQILKTVAVEVNELAG
jgi:hypothetical protein